jgi:hypothetical protein
MRAAESNSRPQQLQPQLGSITGQTRSDHRMQTRGWSCVTGSRHCYWWHDALHAAAASNAV